MLLQVTLCSHPTAAAFTYALASLQLPGFDMSAGAADGSSIRIGGSPGSSSARFALPVQTPSNYGDLQEQVTRLQQERQALSQRVNELETAADFWRDVYIMYYQLLEIDANMAREEQAMAEAEARQLKCEVEDLHRQAAEHNAAEAIRRAGILPAALSSLTLGAAAGR